MDKEVFQKQMDRLADLFGPKNYNTDRVILIWREVNTLSNEFMVQTTDHFVGSCRVAPLVPEFREQVNKERERVWKVQKQENKRDSLRSIGNYICQDCFNSGVAWVDGCVYKCHCDHGAHHRSNFPRLSRNNLKVVNNGN